MRTYLRFLGKEFLQPVNYLVAAGIGVLVLLLQGSSPFSSVAPYVVPVFVQALSKSYLKYTGRHKDMLLSLPSRRPDPAFLMDQTGEILLSTGTTEEQISKNGIQRLEDLLDKEGRARVLHCIEKSDHDCGPVESYSPPFEKWYQIRASQSVDRRHVLVWCEDITARRQLDQKLFKIREFSDDIISDISELIETDTSFVRLARLMLDLGYEGVFIAQSAGNKLVGTVYKGSTDEIVSSEPIRITEQSEAPIWLSRRSGRMYYDEIGVGGSSGRIYSENEFFEVYPFDERVVRFLGAPIRSFVNYHEGDIAVIAFNLNRPIGSGDLLAMEILVNSARSVSSLLSLAAENENKFLQSVTGLCAAAEYSDEITGMHILRVNEYSRLIAKKVGMAEKGQFHIGQVAAMHDIGKVAIPHLIKLERAFTPEERKEMEMHTIYGAQIIEKMMTCCAATEPRLAMAYEIALNHHQQWNGQGYPPIISESGRRAKLASKTRGDYDRLRPAVGSEIPLTARIVSLADTYDALRSARQYKAGKTHAETVEIIKIDDRTGLRGEERFGPDVMEIFMTHHSAFQAIYDNMQE